MTKENQMSIRGSNRFVVVAFTAFLALIGPFFPGTIGPG